MKIILGAAIVGVALASTCQELCDCIPGCKNSPEKQGSHCNDQGICSGIYKRPNGDLCYYNNDNTCPQTDPVACPPGDASPSEITASAHVVQKPAEVGTSVQGPSGGYRGTNKTLKMTVEAVFNAAARTADIAFSVGDKEKEKKFEGRNLEFAVEGDSIKFLDCDEARAFLAKMPLENLTINDITTSYNAATDKFSVSFLGLTFVTEKM
jgi:hypothetical protein